MTKYVTASSELPADANAKKGKCVCVFIMTSKYQTDANAKNSKCVRMHIFLRRTEHTRPTAKAQIRQMQSSFFATHNMMSTTIIRKI